MKKEELIKEVVQNFPEYSISMQCLSYNYNDCIFTFRDYEDGKAYTVCIKEFLKGYVILNKLWLNKKVFFCGINHPKDFDDPCNWDADVVDALLQCSIFGEIIYG